MKILKRLILLLIIIGCIATIPVNAQRSRDNKIYLDLAGATICGLDSTEFSQYYANIHNSDVNQVDLILKRFLSKFSKKFDEETKDVIQKNDLVGILSIKEITDQAGIRGKLYVWKNGIWDKYISAPINVADGRWNTFEELLYENGEIGAKQAGKLILTQLQNNPLYGSGDALPLDSINGQISHGGEFQLKYSVNNSNQKSIDEVIKYFKTFDEAIDFMEKIENEISPEIILNCEITEIK